MVLASTISLQDQSIPGVVGCFCLVEFVFMERRSPSRVKIYLGSRGFMSQKGDYF
jgi:hypothetical protein